MGVRLRLLSQSQSLTCPSLGNFACIHSYSILFLEVASVSQQQPITGLYAE